MTQRSYVTANSIATISFATRLSDTSSPILSNRKFIQASRRLVTGQWLPIASFAYHQHASIYLTALIAIDPSARINYRIDQVQEVNP